MKLLFNFIVRSMGILMVMYLFQMLSWPTFIAALIFSYPVTWIIKKLRGDGK